MNTQRNIIIAFVVVLLALTAYRFTHSAPTSSFARPLGTTDQPTSMQKKCAVDIHAIVLEDKGNQFQTPEAITRAMFDHYFSFYKQIPDCPTDALADYSLRTVGKITDIPQLPKAFTAEITFDLKPLSMEKTLWKSAEATVDKDWIRNKKGVLSIRTVMATSSAATTTHFLSI